MNTKRGYYEGLICTLSGKDEIWYGAGNLHRTSYGGRAQQYWSEDATLDYFNGYYECKAAQSVGCITCVKHMCCNDQEAQRTGLSVFVDEQALREIYLRAFEGSFAGGALSVMATTGRVGTTLGKNYYPMMTTVLRDEWGFQGHVTSDGYVNTGYYNNTLEELEAGMDYSCCDSNGSNAQRILNAINKGDGYVLQLMRQAAKRNLYVMTKTASMNGLGSGAKVISIVPAWEMAVLVVNIVVAVAFVAFLILAILESRKNRAAVVVKKEEA
jgi:beta-glucosidase